MNVPLIVNSNFNHLSHLHLLEKRKNLVISKMNKCHSYRNDANLCFEHSLNQKCVFIILALRFTAPGAICQDHKIILFNCS